MNASWIEMALRLAAAGMATVAFGLCWQLARRTSTAPRPLYVFLAAVVGLQAAWRWFVLWWGSVDEVGDLGWVVPWVQPLTAVLLFLVLLAVSLIVHFRLSHPVDHG